MRNNTPRNSLGMTLLELLIVIAITAILGVIAIPNFVNMVSHNRIVSESNLLLGMLTFARGEAIKRNEKVALCKSVDGVWCSNGANVYWNHGIIIFVDSNANKTRDKAEAIIRSELPFSTIDKIEFNNGNALVYRANGASSGGTFIVSFGARTKQVVVSLAGRSRIE